jgi:hypothetical protein
MAAAVVVAGTVLFGFAWMSSLMGRRAGFEASMAVEATP